jgi:cobalt-zinc-cadmium efflux system membrane fusion protein
LEAPGTIRPDTQKSVAVRAPLPGRLGRVLVDVGTRVRRGTPLATLTGTEVSDAVARFRTAGAKADAARRALARADRLLALQAISRAERETRAAENEVAAAELAAAAQDLRTLGISGRGVAASADIVAPIGGVVLEKTASPGLLVDKDAPLFVVADLSTVWAVVDVYEKDVAGVTRGGEAEVRSNTYADAAWRGPVALVEPAVDEASKMARVRIVLANPDRRLRPGMRVTAALPLQQSAGMAVTAVPVLAVQRLSGVTSVFAEVTPGHYVLRTVELGRERGGVVEVTAGLREGERIVVAGGFYLKGELLKARFGAEFALVEFC